MRILVTRTALGICIILLVSCASSNIRFPTGSLGEPYDNPKIVSGILRIPEGEGPFPAVVLIHGCGGLAPFMTQEWPRYLTGLSYAVLVVDSYGSRGAKHCLQIKYRHTRILAEDAFGALDYLATLPSIDANRVGVMGFSRGAIAVSTYIVNSIREETEGVDYKAAIALYGACSSEYDSDSVPLMAIAAEKDLKNASPCIVVGKQSPDLEVYVIPGAYHGFDSKSASGKTNFGGTKMQYSESATNKARQLTKEFFAKHLGI